MFSCIMAFLRVVPGRKRCLRPTTRRTLYKVTFWRIGASIDSSGAFANWYSASTTSKISITYLMTK